MTDILVVAAEPSGDALGAELVRAARAIVPNARFFGSTGPELESARVERIVDTASLSVMGLTEVIGRLPTAWRALGRLEREAARRGAVGAILVDAPDFNLRLARRLGRHAIAVVQVVAPTVWAWRPGRIGALERDVRRLLLTLPFERDVFAGTAVDAVYVGHPAVDRVPDDVASRQVVAAELGLPASRPWVALLPGSRAAELDRLGPPLAGAAERIAGEVPGVAFLAPVAPGVEPERVRAALAGVPDLALVVGDRHAALAHAEAAITASGTASLELALLGVPHVVAYRVSRPTYAIARALVSVDRVALPNLVAGRRVVPEFLQAAVEPAALAGPVVTWLREPADRDAAVAGLGEVRAALGVRGVAARAARAALEAIDPQLVPDRV